MLLSERMQKSFQLLFTKVVNLHQNNVDMIVCNKMLKSIFDIWVNCSFKFKGCARKQPLLSHPLSLFSITLHCLVVSLKMFKYAIQGICMF